MGYANGIEEFINRCNKVMPPDFYKLPLNKQRNLYLELTNEFFYKIPEKVSIDNDIVSVQGQNLTFRRYTPDYKSGNGVLIYIRGGGFVVGSLETHNTVVAELCEKSGLITIAPDFRMSPEYPFPQALEDCYNILCDIVNNANAYNIDPERIVICGDSSGANIAVCLAMMCRDRNGPVLCGQALISPVLDFTRWQNGGQDAPLLTGGEMEYYTSCYIANGKDATHPYISPLINGKFHNLPPAYIMGAELDSLLIDSQEYMKHLQKNGINVELVVEPGLVHSAVRARGLSLQVADAWQRFCQKAAQLALAPKDLNNDK